MPGFGPMNPSGGIPPEAMSPEQTINTGQAYPDPTMGILGGAGISGIGSLLSAGINLYSAAQNRRWQERMANTSWQRSVADMKAAGINPIFAATKGGAPMPSSPAATVNDLGLGAIGAGVSSAAQAKAATYRMIQGMSMTDAQIRQQDLQNQLTAKELERQSLVTAQLQNEVDLTTAQKEGIEADKARAKEYQKVYEFLGPAGSVIFDLFRDFLGKGATGIIRGPWSGGSAARGGRIIDRGGNVHDDTSGTWRSPYPGGKDTP